MATNPHPCMTHLHHPPSLYFLCLFLCRSSLMIRQRECGVCSSHDLQLASSRRSNSSSSSSACRSSRWALLHVDGEGREIAGLMGLVLLLMLLLASQNCCTIDGTILMMMHLSW